MVGHKITHRIMRFRGEKWFIRSFGFSSRGSVGQNLLEVQLRIQTQDAIDPLVHYEGGS